MMTSTLPAAKRGSLFLWAEIPVSTDVSLGFVSVWGPHPAVPGNSQARPGPGQHPPLALAPRARLLSQAAAGAGVQASAPATPLPTRARASLLDAACPAGRAGLTAIFCSTPWSQGKPHRRSLGQLVFPEEEEVPAQLPRRPVSQQDPLLLC